MARLHTNQHYITLHRSPHLGDPAIIAAAQLPHRYCVRQAAHHYCTAPQTTPPHTTGTHTAASDLKIISRIEVIQYQRRPRQILQVNLLFLAGSEDGGSDAGEATTGMPRLQEFSDSVWAGKSSKEHQFDLGRNPPWLVN